MCHVKPFRELSVATSIKSSGLLQLTLKWMILYRQKITIKMVIQNLQKRNVLHRRSFMNSKKSSQTQLLDVLSKVWPFGDTRAVISTN